MEVKTPKREGRGDRGGHGQRRFVGRGETWEYEVVDQRTETETVNTYVVIMGQAVVVKSETESWACKGSG